MIRNPLNGFIYSIPERLLRSLTGLGGGAAREIGEVLLPARVRRSRLYQSSVGMTLRFLIEQVGQIEQVDQTGSESLPPDFLIRRAAGNVVELAGLASFHASPVWVFAALADLAGVGRELIGEISEALEKEGLVTPGGQFHSVDQMLDALERTAGCLTEAVNTPPLDIATLRAEWAELRREASRLPKATLPIDRLYSQWRELRHEAASQGQSVLQLSSVMALAAVRELPENTRRLSKVIKVGSKRAGGMLASGLLDHYGNSLAEIRKAGFIGYWLREFRPYMKGAVRQFSPKHVSTTEWLLLRGRGKRRKIEDRNDSA